MKKERNRRRRRRSVSDCDYTTFARNERILEAITHPLPDFIEKYVKFFQYFRMTHVKFTVLIDLLKPDISGENISLAWEKLPFRES
jgi:hypothetical protein